MATRTGLALCPRCQTQTYLVGSGALSRADDRTEICSACGTDEAMVTMAGRGAPSRTGRDLQPVSAWPVDWQSITHEIQDAWQRWLAQPEPMPSRA